MLPSASYNQHSLSMTRGLPVVVTPPKVYGFAVVRGVVMSGLRHLPVGAVDTGIKLLVNVLFW